MATQDDHSEWISITNNPDVVLEEVLQLKHEKKSLLQREQELESAYDEAYDIQVTQAETIAALERRLRESSRLADARAQSEQVAESLSDELLRMRNELNQTKSELRRTTAELDDVRGALAGPAPEEEDGHWPEVAPVEAVDDISRSEEQEEIIPVDPMLVLQQQEEIERLRDLLDEEENRRQALESMVREGSVDVPNNDAVSTSLADEFGDLCIDNIVREAYAEASNVEVQPRTSNDTVDVPPPYIAPNTNDIYETADNVPSYVPPLVQDSSITQIPDARFINHLATSTPVRSLPQAPQAPTGYLLTVHEAAEPEFDPLKEDERLAMRLMATFQEEELRYQRMVEEDSRIAHQLSSEESRAADHQRTEVERIAAEDRRLAEIAATAEIAASRDEEMAQLDADEQLARLLAESSSEINYAPGDYSTGLPRETSPQLSYPVHSTTQLLEDERLAWEVAGSDEELPPVYIRPEGIASLEFRDDSPPTYVHPGGGRYPASISSVNDTISRSSVVYTCETSTPNTVFNPLFEDSGDDLDVDRAQPMRSSTAHATEPMRMASGLGNYRGETPGPVVIERLLGRGDVARSMAKMVC